MLMKYIIPLLGLYLALPAYGIEVQPVEYIAVSKGADQVVIRTRQGKEILNSKNPLRIIEIIELFKTCKTFKALDDGILASENGDTGKFDCGCSGSHEVEFYKENELILSFSIVHRMSIRSPQINDGYMISLTDSSQNLSWQFLNQLETSLTTKSTRPGG